MLGSRPKILESRLNSKIIGITANPTHLYVRHGTQHTTCDCRISILRC